MTTTHDRRSSPEGDHTAPSAAHAHTGSEGVVAVAVLGASLAAFLVYAFSAGDVPYWLDSGEFTAAAIELDIAHPPGHPLAALWGGLFTLLPVGPLAYRVALSQAVAGALAVAALTHAIIHVLRRVALSANAASAVAAAIAIHFGASYALWFQSIRAEVYALEAMLVCFALERSARALCPASPDEPPEARARALYAATFALSLGLTNHHLIAILALPVLACAWWSLGLARIVARTLVCLAITLVNLALYVYLPLRAAHPLPMNLGTPEDLRRIWWVVSAQVYARHMGTGETDSLGSRLFDLLAILLTEVSAPLLFASALGIYLGLRTGRTRSVTAMWLLAALSNLGVRTWLGPIHSNPDMLGYMLPGFAALLVLAALGGALLVGALTRGASPRMPAALWWLLPVLALGRFGSAHADTTLAHFQVTDELADDRLRNLPSDSVLILTTPQANFLHWAYLASERLRPDVAVVPLPFLDYPGVAEAVVARDPRLARVVDGYRTRGLLPRDEVLRLAERIPVFIELDARESLALYPFAEPSASFSRIRSAPLSPQALSAGDRKTRDFSVFLAALTNSRDAETAHQAAWAHYVAALQLASGGATGAAASHVRAARALTPEAQELDALERALAAADGPLDIARFLPHAGGPAPR